MSAWERHQLATGPILPSGQRMVFYVLKPPGWVALQTAKYRCLVWEHEDQQGNRAYQGDDQLPFACQADQWFNNSAFQGAYPGIILVPACDQTTGSDERQNFGGWTQPNDNANEDSVALCAQWAVANLGADPTKLIVGGASLGGIGTWALALDHNCYNGSRSKTFCAFIPMAGVVERNGFGVGPTPAQLATLTGLPIFAVHGAGDTTSQPNWDLSVWDHFSLGAPTVGGPAGGQAGTFRLLFDKSLAHDVWDHYVPLPNGKPIWDWAWRQTATGVSPPVANPSPDNTIVLFGSGGQITDASGSTWAITANAQIAKDGRVDDSTRNVTQIAYESGWIWQQNQAGNWYSWQGTGWSDGTTTSPIPGAPPPPPPPPGPNPTPAGFFKVAGGKILRPDGSTFAGGGFNVDEDQFSSVNLALVPGTRIIRIACHAYVSAAILKPFVDAMSAKQIVTVIEDHTGISHPPYTGSALATELAWYAGLATAFKANPYVWFGTFNEPGNGTNLAAIAQQEKAIYDAIRGTGSFALILMELPSGGNPGLVGAMARGYDGAGPMTPALYATMFNIVWDLHYYGWVSQYSTNIPTITAALQGSIPSASGISGAQSITSADGLVPVIIGEFGNSTTGEAIDANGVQVCNVVAASGRSWIAWGWRPGGAGDKMFTDANVITDYGRQIAGLIQGMASANPIGGVTPPPSGPTKLTLQNDAAAIVASLTGAQAALTKLSADIALLP